MVSFQGDDAFSSLRHCLSTTLLGFFLNQNQLAYGTEERVPTNSQGLQKLSKPYLEAEVPERLSLEPC